LYNFGGHAENAIGPVAGLTDVDGILYGTTPSGGAYDKDGTVFSITTAGKEHVLHSFGSGDDGVKPQSSLIDVNGTLYGATELGGNGGCQFQSRLIGCGTVYSISTTGREKVLYSFAGRPDGTNPMAGLIDVNGTLYGTTRNGGTYDLGTVYSVSMSGAEKVLYSFTGRDGDGARPMAGLINVSGTLYGTTLSGGKNRYGQPGTVFRISTNGKERVLYRFRGVYDDDGEQPLASLLDVKGVLYGTTSSGGRNVTGGTVFSITTTGKEHVLHSFGGSADGRSPYANLINVNGTLYGTTVSGGAYATGGTVFSISTTGEERVLHSFGSGSDGKVPAASLIDVNATLYGTTAKGGAHGHGSGEGTVFALNP